jgi:serine/threonine protein kinase
MLSVGTRLGPYEIVAPIGAGGMGEVYRAHDDRLERDVALKVLPPDSVGDTERLERFVREARVLAALSHPHIVTIYSTEEADGIPFLTMEALVTSIGPWRSYISGSVMPRSTSTLRVLSSARRYVLAMLLELMMSATVPRCIIGRLSIGCMRKTSSHM